MSLSMHSPRVLSIQSHVVSGYVGNKSAIFPLQLLGFEVDPINSVQFSNHTGYKMVAGQVLSANDLDQLIGGLETNGLDKRYTHLLTGYIGSISFLKKITDVVKYLKQHNNPLIYVCDPVMGDNGKMYVPNDLLPVYRDEICPLADILTPNQFELELLTGRRITNTTEAWDTVDVLHTKGCKTVVVSSTDLALDSDKFLLALASTKIDNIYKEKVEILMPKLPATFTGTGDLFAAILLAWMHKTEGQLKLALEYTVGTLNSVLRRTLAQNLDSVQNVIELKLIQSKVDIEQPEVVVEAKRI